MKIKSSKFIVSCTNQKMYPDESIPEIAFAGRSNVGKSSLINMLLSRKNLARTSSTPGKTQLINFFDIDGLFRVVDLPGYGFARVSKTKKLSWGKYIESYLRNRQNLLEVFLLVDIRHKPTEHDKMMYDFIIASGFSAYVFATKLDKIKRSEIKKNLNIIAKELNMPSTDMIFPVSNNKREGKYQAWDKINEIFEINRLDIYFERQIKRGKNDS